MFTTIKPSQIGLIQPPHSPNMAIALNPATRKLTWFGKLGLNINLFQISQPTLFVKESNELLFGTIR